MARDSERLEEAVELLKEPVQLDPAFDQRVMAAVRATPRPLTWMQPVWAGIEWMRRGRSVTVSPLGGLAMAAGLAAILLVGRAWLPQGASGPTVATTSGPEEAVVQFVIVAPTASAVSLVGDFNDWSATATPMRRVEGDGLWSVTVPLEPGRYRYAFLADGAVWMRDPSAPPALDDDFGPPGSVVTIGEL